MILLLNEWKFLFQVCERDSSNWSYWSILSLFWNFSNSSSCNTQIILLVILGGFRCFVTVGKRDLGTQFWESENIVGNGFISIFNRILLPLLLRYLSSKWCWHKKIFFRACTSVLLRNFTQEACRWVSLGRRKTAAELCPGYYLCSIHLRCTCWPSWKFAARNQ